MFSFNKIIIRIFQPKVTTKSATPEAEVEKEVRVGPKDYEPQRSGRKCAAPKRLEGESPAPKRAEKGTKKATPAPPPEPPTSPVVKGIKRAESSIPYILARTAAKSAAYIPQVNPIKTSHYFWRKFVPKARRISHPA